MAQKVVVSGTVTDQRTGRKLTQASVTAKGEGVTVVTNDDGYFALKTDRKPEAIVVSHLGYETKEIKIDNAGSLQIKLKPTAIELHELVVWTENPRELVNIAGGPVQPLFLDVAKNTDFLLNDEELDNYDFTMDVPTQIDDRTQYVINIKPRVVTDYALYYGKFYIDRENLAFTRVELSLDMSDREKATRLILVRKPLGVRFKPREMTSLVEYRYEDGVTRLSYIRNVFRFNCDWKRKLLSTSFTATCEMVVTDKSPTTERPISGRDSFDSKDFFYDRVEYFRDPDFWKDYNIIEPTETLDNAIGKLLKRYD